MQTLFLAAPQSMGMGDVVVCSPAWSLVVVFFVRCGRSGCAKCPQKKVCCSCSSGERLFLESKGGM